MITPGDFALLKNLDEAPDGLYKLIRFEFNPERAIRLCFRNENGQYAELGVNDIQHIEKVLPTQTSTKVKIA